MNFGDFYSLTLIGAADDKLIKSDWFCREQPDLIFDASTASALREIILPF